MPGDRAGAVARRPPGGIARRAVLPRGVHCARGDRHHCVPEPAFGLRHPVPGGLRDAAHHRCRSDSPGSGDRLPGRAPHLGAEPDAPPSLRIPGIIISLIFGE